MRTYNYMCMDSKYDIIEYEYKWYDRIATICKICSNEYARLAAAERLNCMFIESERLDKQQH